MLRAIALALRLELEKRKARGKPHTRWFRETEVSRPLPREGLPLAFSLRAVLFVYGSALYNPHTPKDSIQKIVKLG